MLSRLLLICIGICIYTSSISQDITELTFDPMTMQRDDFITLSNTGGTNNLEDYPVRSEYKFSGPEKIYKLPRMGGDFLCYSNGRFPDIEVDFFILTDPTDASTAMMWMNGTGTKMRMTADPNTDYYLVIDGFENTEASVQFAVAYAPPIPEICRGLIDLNQFLTEGDSDDIEWRIISGGSGSIGFKTGIFTPDEMAEGKFQFEAKKNQGDEDNASTELFCLIIKDCTIPTMGHWALFILALLFLVIGIGTVRKQATKNAV